MASEGSREIEAARQRLAAAKTQASSAAKMMESARLMVEVAQKEVNAAESCLKDAEKRWEVTDIESDDESLEIQGRIKRRKVALSTEGSNGSDGDGASVDTTAAVCSDGDDDGDDASVNTPVMSNTTARAAGTPVHRSSDVASAGVAAAVRQPTSETMASGSTREVYTVASGASTEVCTLLESNTVGNVDGTYQRVSASQRGFRMYRKKGLWNEHALDFVMYRGVYHRGRGDTTHWFIGVSGCKTLFVNLSRKNTGLPPRDGWTAMDKPKVTPLLKDAIVSHHLRLHFGTVGKSSAMNRMIDERKAIEEKTRGVARVVVERCGIPEINGIYTQFHQRDGSHKTHDDVPWFHKKGQWEGNTVTYVLFRKDLEGRKIWSIGAVDGAVEVGVFFVVKGNFNTVGPPGNGWRAIGKGINPAPTLRVLD